MAKEASIENKVGNRSFPLSQGIFFLVLAICLVQALKGGDFMGYVRQARGVKLNPVIIPYPTEAATAGDYFQSPFTTVFLIVLAGLPDWLIRVGFNLTSLAGVLVLIRSYLRGASLGMVFFLLLFFTHALSDVFLSQNLIFSTLVLLVAAEQSICTSERFTLAGFFLALAILFRLIPMVGLLWYFIDKKRRRAVLPTLVFLGIGIGITFLYFGWRAGEWWHRWLIAVSLYSQAASPIFPGFQTPTAVVYRWLMKLTSLGESARLRAMSGVGLAYVFVTLFAASRLIRNESSSKFAFPLVLTVYFVSFGCVWAMGELFLFPLVCLTIEDGIPPILWWPAAAFALLPKWLWPVDLWHVLAGWGLPAFALMSPIAYGWVTKLMRRGEIAAL